MTTSKFSKSEAVRFGWEVTKSNFWFFVNVLIVVLLIYIPTNIIELIKEDTAVALVLFFYGIYFIFLILNVINEIGLIKISLKFCDNEKGKLSDLFLHYPLFFKFILGVILYGLIILGGAILLIIPGIIWGIKFQFFSYFIIDKGLGPIEALKKSALITKGVKLDLFIFAILLGFINIIGILLLGIGLFATLPTTILAQAFVYRKLLSQAELS